MTEYELAVDSNMEGLTSESPGLCSGCPECLEVYNCTAEEIENGQACDDGGFSWHSCDGCGSGLGGDRHPAHALDGNNELVHLEVCTDCVLFWANGDLPESWDS